MNHRRFLVAVAAWLTVGGFARAEVVTVLSRNETQVGQPVVLLYRFTDTEQPQDMPQPSILVDGLDIVFQGASRQNNFSFSFGGGGSQNRSQSVFEYTYMVMPLRPGEFTVPGFAVRVGGKTLRTKPAKLTVFGAGGNVPSLRQPAPGVPQGVLPQPMQPLPPTAQALPQPRAQAPLPSEPDGRAYFGEVVMTSKPVYVGEVVPVDIRYYFRGDVPISDLQHPTFAGDGFTAVPLEEPQQSEQIIGNIPYRVFTFRSAITPVKTGDLKIPPVTMNGRIMVSAAPPGFDAFFDQFFGNLPMPGIGRPEQIEVSAPGRSLKVLPLPREGRPPGFTGAVGQFSLEASVDPTAAGPGEPVTLSLAISGRGNFDAMSPPELTGADVWRTYAPKVSFQSDDAVGSAGTKTFDFKMVARTDQTATPGAEFSFFDPRKKEYVTLKAEPQAVDAAGRGSVADEQISSATAANAGDADEPLPALAEQANDVSAPAPALAAGAAQSFRSALQSPWFHQANIALLVLTALLLPLLFWLRRRKAKSARTAELEWALRQAKSSLQKASDCAEFYNAAAHFLRARLELLNGNAGTVPDAAAALRHRVSDPVERRELETILARRDELKYGGGSGGGALRDEERRKVVSLLEKFAAAR